MCHLHFQPKVGLGMKVKKDIFKMFPKNSSKRCIVLQINLLYLFYSCFHIKAKIKNVQKKGRVWHLPDSCLETSLEQRELGEKMKYTELSANTDWKLLTFHLFTGLSLLQWCYRRDSARCRTLPFFLTFFIISPFQVFLLY